jgi:hypothetical protein
MWISNGEIISCMITQKKSFYEVGVLFILKETLCYTCHVYLLVWFANVLPLFFVTPLYMVFSLGFS